MATPEQSNAEVSEAARTGREATTAYYSFESPERLAELLASERWPLIKAMTGRPPESVEVLAALTGREVDAVQADLDRLVLSGVVERQAAESVLYEFPFDTVHVELEVWHKAT